METDPLAALMAVTDEEREHFEERAAIRQYHGEQSREEAERGAVQDIVVRRRDAVVKHP
jgi:hypothetical protein